MTRFTPIPFAEVHIDDPFWNERLRINREISIPFQYKQCEQTGRIHAFTLQWKPGDGTVPHYFWDSDVAKWVEAASYSLATHPDPRLEQLLEETVALIASSQQPDGYLNSHFSQVEKEKRWTNLRDNHELYSAGHLIEAGIAHYQVTGKRTLLDVVCRFADYIDTVFGREKGKKRGYCGHPEIELALVKLYRATSQKRYLKLSRYFVEERGRKPLYFELEARARGEHSWYDGAHSQSHLPIREQKDAVGHAVRALYLYCGITDLAGELNDPSLRDISQTLWESVSQRQMYVTGGIGSSRHNEGFTKDYDLPNETAYCETCASVAVVMWNHRLLQLDCDRRYADVMERALYNGVISGVSLDGTKFFYENPLASRGGHHRQPWFGCACCPSNLSRLLASLGNYVFSRTDDVLAVHLYIQGKLSSQTVGNAAVQIAVETRYPWEGQVQLKIEVDHKSRFSLRLRIPEWCNRHTLRVAGKPFKAPLKKGYAVINRVWTSGDIVEINFDMPVEQIEANPVVLMDQGHVALQRGPIVYCVEEANFKTDVFNLTLPKNAKLRTRWDPKLLSGVTVIEGRALTLQQSGWKNKLYRKAEDAPLREIPFLAVPYYAWDNQKPGGMTVWIRSKTVCG